MCGTSDVSTPDRVVPLEFFNWREEDGLIWKWNDVSVVFLLEHGLSGEYRMI